MPTFFRFQFPALPLITCLLIAAVAPVLGGCAIAVGGAAAVGVAAYEERSVLTVARDTTLASKIRLELLNTSQQHAAKVGTEVFEGRALMTGAVPTEKMRAEAVKVAWSIDGVKDVINEIQIFDSGLIDTARDSWVTAQLSTKLTFDQNIHAINYTAETVNGIVYLIGIAQNQAELDRVIGHARNVGYVRKVISHVRVKKAVAKKAGS